MTKRYDEYKDSGIEWLGGIPSHWEINKLKRAVVKNQRGITPKYVDEEVSTENPILNQACIYTNHIKFERVKYNLEASNKNIKGKVLNKDILICSTGGGTAGRVGFFDYILDNYVVDSHVSIVRTNDLYISRFFYYLLNTISFGGQIKGCIKGATNQEELSNSRLNEIKTVKLSKEEQQAIADYLDNKTSKIDSAVTELEKQKSLLIELKKSTIHQAVTKGLDLTVPMKDSGVEWIGEVPSHWNIIRLKDKISISSGKSAIKEDEGYLLYGANGIIGKTKDFNIDRKKIIIGRVGSCGAINIAKEKSFISDNALIVNEKTVFFDYLYYLLINKNLGRTASKVAMPLITAGKVLEEKLLFVDDIKEQKMISNYLDKKTGQIDQSIEVIYNQIAQMKEYKKTLINDVVTGKIKVI